jgi:hypothetical protein
MPRDQGGKGVLGSGPGVFTHESQVVHLHSTYTSTPKRKGNGLFYGADPEGVILMKQML